MMREFLKKSIAFLLTLEARALLRKHRPKIVAITGSVGKTATKDAIYALLSRSAHTRKSEKSFNSEIGLPLTVLGRPNAWRSPLRWVENLIDGLFLIIASSRYPEWLVLEVGADRPGDIRKVAAWLRTDIVVITRLPETPVHVEFFDSPLAVVKEKASLIRSLKKDGTLVLFGDEQTSALVSRAEGRKIVTFGLNDEDMVRVRDSAPVFEEGEHERPVGMRATLVVDNDSAPIEIVGAIGVHALLPLLAGAAVGKALGKSLPDILEALKSYEPPRGRMHLVLGIKDTTIIDDTYNSSPAAVEAALEALALCAKKRKVAVLGDMSELGRYSVSEHRKAGAHAAKICDLLITVGIRARDIAQGALDSGMDEAKIFQYEDAKRAGAELQNMLKMGDTILVKGSQVMRMERVVEEIMAQPERAGELLVRQDEEWKKR